MPTLHDAAHRDTRPGRLQSLRPDSTPKWGVMRVDQMLWHVNTALDMVLGRVDAPRDKLPLPLPIMRFMVAGEQAAGETSRSSFATVRGVAP